MMEYGIKELGKDLEVNEEAPRGSPSNRSGGPSSPTPRFQ